MPAKHRKLSRKELKQPDEFMNVAVWLEDFLAGHLRELIFSAATVIVIVVVFLGILHYQKVRDRRTAERFYDAVTALGAGRFAGAEQDFRNLAQSGSNRELGRLANLYLASAYLEQRDLAKARDALMAYIVGADDSIFRSRALLNLGLVYEQLSDFQKAENAYRQAAQTKGPDSLNAELALARILERRGHNDEAIAAYRQFLQRHPLAPQRQSVMETLANLGISPKSPVSAPK